MTNTTCGALSACHGLRASGLGRWEMTVKFFFAPIEPSATPDDEPRR
jgi:hypothetical protein